MSERWSDLARDRPPILTSPRGRLLAPRLCAPDYGDAERPKPQGEYWTRLALDPADPAVARFLDALEERREQALAQARGRMQARGVAANDDRPPALTENPLTRPHVDPVDGAPSGAITLRFSMPATIRFPGPAAPRGPARDRWRRRPVVFDSVGKPFWSPPPDLDGRPARISFQPIPYLLSAAGVAGLKLSLIAVMLLDPAAPPDPRLVSARDQH